MTQNNAALELIDLLVTRNFDPEIFDVKTGNPPKNDRGDPDNSRANQFLFHFIGDSGEDYGTVEILFADGVMTVGSGNNTGRGIENPKDKQSWYDFLLQLKKFAVRHDFANFQVDNISRMKYLRQSMAQLTESFQGRGQYSWSGQPTEARMLIKHSRRLAETDARFRHIDSIFLETADGERYRLPTRSLSHGRAMLEHIRAGGRPWDARGAHINHIVEQLQILSRFRRAHQGRLFEGDAADLVNETNNYFGSLRKNLKSLATKSGYSKYFESWQPDAVNESELVVEDLRDLFVETRIDPRIEQALPLLAKIKEHNMKEADIFEAWANRLTEGTWAIPDTEEKMTKLKLFLSQPQAVGADADNATAALGDILGDDNLFDQLEELAETDPDADARPVVQAWLNANQNYPEIMAIVRELEQEPDVDQEISMTAQDMPDRDSDMREGDNLANPLEEVYSPGAMAMFPEQKSVAEGLDPIKKRRLYDLIELYRDATDPSDYYDRDIEDPDEVIAMIRSEFGDKIADQVEAGAHKMHYPRHDIQRSDPLGWKKPVDRITKAGKMFKQDSDYMKNTIKSRYKNSGKSATEGVAEAGPFSYGKAPRRGSVADLAAKKRQEQERGKQPIEPKDQQVGVAKVTKGVAEGSKMAQVDKLAKAPKPKNQQEYDAIEKYRKDLAQSYKSKKQQGVAEGLSEMDKSQTPPGRDGGTDLTKKQIHLGPEHVIKAKDVAKHALKALDKSMKKSHADTPKKKGVAEGYTVTRGIDKERYQARDGLEGPFSTKSGKVVYYDKVEGKYYDPDTDMYIEYDDWQAMNEQGMAEGQCNMSEAGTSCPVHGMTECYMESVHTDPKGFAQPTGAAFESQLARIKSLALLK